MSVALTGLVDTESPSRGVEKPDFKPMVHMRWLQNPEGTNCVFYTRPSIRQPIFDSWFNTAVIYHDNYPNFSEQVCLLCSCICETASTNLLTSKEKSNSNNNNNNSNNKKPVESSTGYSWIPILGTDGK
ncbi:unnamed protein product [Schistosoma mattheei]|uniref:Uncharacterized protein n=1 Tax=Schistosoma mattheei TaxID=31246 RepID=A0A183PPV5_9TREM|nr:unnamed protein product [Schistosoma mattheei]